tara:strand:- start:535 stop:927 length:393 start_codon:yes stop_codon:yes gene_type:complete
MYYFVYYFIYCFAKEKNPAPESYSAGAVMLMVVFHLALVFGIIKYFFSWSLPLLNEDYFPNKLLILPIFFFIYWITSWYYEKKSDMICKRYDKVYGRGKKRLYSLKNNIWVLALYLVPLFIGIQLINMSN